MRLTDMEKEIFDGKHGEAPRIALMVLVELGDLYGAHEMLKISQAHLDTTVYMVDAGVEFAEKLAELGGKVAVPTSLNAAAIDQIRWKEYRTPPELLDKCRRLESAYLRMEANPTWTCAPYQQGMIPRYGEQIAWGESNAIAFANSIIGARTNRYGDLMDICAAIVGEVPKFGLHLLQNRKAELLIRLNGITSEMLDNRALYPLLGFLLGEMAGDRIAVIQGIPESVDVDSLKAFSAAAASSGAVGLFHILGVTPEAQIAELCFRGESPKEVLEINPWMVRDAEERLSTLRGKFVDLVTIGCPHFSFAEFRQLTRLLNGRKVHSAVSFWVFTSRAVYGWLENSGMLKELQNSGAMVFTDGCPLQYPKKTWHFSAAMTDSAKFANYCFSQTGLNVIYGSLKECVDTAVHGKISRTMAPWRKN